MKASLLEQFDDEKRAHLIVIKMEKQMKKQYYLAYIGDDKR